MGAAAWHPTGNSGPPGALATEVSTVAAYRDRWRIANDDPLDERGSTRTTEQTGQRRLAQSAVTRAKAFSGTQIEQRTIPVPEAAVEVRRGVEL